MINRELDKSDILLEKIIEGVIELKGKDITVLDLKNIETAVCKYFVICCGSSSTHVSSLSQNIKKFVYNKINEKPWNIEEDNTSEWILLDYSDIVIHVFQEKTRSFYDLEDLWGDAEIRKIENI